MGTHLPHFITDLIRINFWPRTGQSLTFFKLPSCFQKFWLFFHFFSSHFFGKNQKNAFSRLLSSFRGSRAQKWKVLISALFEPFLHFFTTSYLFSPLFFLFFFMRILSMSQYVHSTYCIGTYTPILIVVDPLQGFFTTSLTKHFIFFVFSMKRSSTIHGEFILSLVCKTIIHECSTILPSLPARMGGITGMARKWK